METRSTIQHLIPEALVSAALVKPVVIKLAWYLNDYKVVGISNTTILKPGEWLSVAAVDQIDKTPGWTTEIADNDIIEMLFGLGAGTLATAAKL